MSQQTSPPTAAGREGGAPRVVVCHGDETGEELLEAALEVLTSPETGFEVALEHFDLSLENRRATQNDVVLRAADAMRETGLGLKAATITPEGADDVGSPNRILREQVGGTVIVRAARRLTGVTPLAALVHPITIVRMATGDAYGAAERRVDGPDGEIAERLETITRSQCRATAVYAFDLAAQSDAQVFGGPKWTVSPTYEGMFKEELDRAAAEHPDVEYHPALIDATYAGLVAASAQRATVVPALNRDGDCLSDLVLALYGTIAGAESVLIGLQPGGEMKVAMAEAPHGTAPALAGRNVANPLAMILACAAVLDHAEVQGHTGAGTAALRIRSAALDTLAAGTSTADVGGVATTTEFVAAVVSRLGELGPSD